MKRLKSIFLILSLIFIFSSCKNNKNQEISESRNQEKEEIHESRNKENSESPEIQSQEKGNFPGSKSQDDEISQGNNDGFSILDISPELVENGFYLNDSGEESVIIIFHSPDMSEFISILSYNDNDGSFSASCGLLEKEADKYKFTDQYGGGDMEIVINDDSVTMPDGRNLEYTELSGDDTVRYMEALIQLAG